MIPISPVLPKSKIPEIVIAKNQPEYRSLPACVFQYSTGEVAVISRWKFSWRERFRVLFGGTIWLQQMTFGQPLQPQLPSVIEPIIEVSDDSSVRE